MVKQEPKKEQYRPPPPPQEELELLETAVNFAQCLASNVVWSQVVHRYALPGAACVLLSDDAFERVEGRPFTSYNVHLLIRTYCAVVLPRHVYGGMDFLKSITETVLHLHKKQTSNKYISSVLEDIAWHRESLCLELLATFVQTGFDPDYEDTRHLLKLLKTGRGSQRVPDSSLFYSYVSCVSCSLLLISPLFWPLCRWVICCLLLRRDVGFAGKSPNHTM